MLAPVYVMVLAVTRVPVALVTPRKQATAVIAMVVVQLVVQAVLALAAQIVLVLVKQDAVEVV